MQKWEYLTLIHTWDKEKQHYYWGEEKSMQMATEDALNRAGKEGWELVAIRTFAETPTAFYHLKRPLE